MQNLQDVNAAIEAAKAAAGNLPASAGVATGQAPAFYAAQPVQPGRAVSMREMLAESSMSVKAYLKAEKAGFLIGTDTANYVKEIAVEFRFGDAKPFYGLRYGDPAKYERSLDRIVNVKNKRPWADCIAEAQRLDARCRGDYASVDVPFTVLEDIKSLDGKITLFEAKDDDRLGWTASVTNWKDFAAFAKPFYDLIDAGRLSEDVVVRGKLVHAQRTSNKNTWGAVTFEGFEAVGFAAAEDQAAA